MMDHPRLIGEMRQIFLDALQGRGIVDKEAVERGALEIAQRTGDPETGEWTAGNLADILVDLAFASHFSDEEIDEHLNYARKLDLFRTLVRILTMEDASHETIKEALRNFCEVPQGSILIDPAESEGTRVALIDRFVSNQLPFIGVAKHYITLRDVDEILTRTYWNPRRHGLIGGKAAGMSLARRILLPKLEEQDPELARYVDIPDSYFLSSGVLADFMDHNGLEQFHLHKYALAEKIEEHYRAAMKSLESARFPDDQREQFRHLLSLAGEQPLIVRSSSLLEDNFGHAFSGKYDSVFLANQGDAESRLAAFEKALKQVLGSALAPAPILYRRDHNLLDFDEQMGILVQKVVGRRFGDYYFPAAAGVAFSYNAYNWTPRIRREDGLVRMVFGLGTHAIDRVAHDYPRMVPLSYPLLRPEIEPSRIRRYSQKQFDALNLRDGRVETIPLLDFLRSVDYPEAFAMVSLQEGDELKAPLFRHTDIEPEKAVITFENFLTKSPFVSLMRKILVRLAAAYGRPVDMEFAWDESKLYILQCRPLLVTENAGKIIVPDVAGEGVLFTTDHFVSNDAVLDIEYIVYVDPKAYARLDTAGEKLEIGRVVNRLNRILGTKRYGLFGPGRWGSNDINLGVRVGYQDINKTLVLGEVAFEEEGGAPEVSYGTHFFIDLVEASIISVAIFPDKHGTIFNEDFFMNTLNTLSDLAPDVAAFSRVVHVIHVPSVADGRYVQIYQDASSQRGVGFLAVPGEYAADGKKR